MRTRVGDDCLRMNMRVPAVANKQIPGDTYVVNQHQPLTVQYGVI
jgi:hypothetical protein